MTAQTTAAQTVFIEDEKPAISGWIVAALFVVAAHVILALVLLRARDEAPNGSEAPAAIMIDLAPVAVAPPAVEQMDVPEAPVKTEEAPPEEVKPPVQDMPPPVEPPQEEVKPPEMAQPVAPPLEPPPVVEPPPVIVPEAPLAPKPEAVLAPPPKPAPKVEKKPEKPVVKREHKPAAARTAAPRHIDAAPSSRAASPQSEAGVPSQSAAEWGGQVRARIMAEKSCPASGGSGTATVAFSITANGGLAGAHLAGSSGNPGLDAEAVSMVRRAAPYPPPPQGRGSGTIPIRFSC